MLASYQLPLTAGHQLVIDEGGALIERSVLPGGIRVITQNIPASPSAVLGLWIPAGSRDEGVEHRGSTHFLEHLLFKGSQKRSALAIAEAFDRVGGDFNAATGKESTHYYCRVRSEDLAMATEVLLDMLVNPRLDQSDFDLERTVILDELAMSQDDPTDVAYETFSLAMYGAGPLGDPVGGTMQTVSATPLSAVRAHHQHWYRPEYLVVAAAGNLNHQQLCDQVLEIVQADWHLDSAASPLATKREKPLPTKAQDIYVGKEVEQAQVLIGVRSYHETIQDRDVMSMLLNVLSGGMSSRLFQEVREKRGLAYTTYAYDQGYSDCGHFVLYAGCAPSNVSQVQKLMWAQLEDLAEQGPTAEEMEIARGQLRGTLALDSEYNQSRMGRLGRSDAVRHELRTIGQILSGTGEVTEKQIQQLATQLIQKDTVKVVVGPQAGQD